MIKTVSARNLVMLRNLKQKGATKLTLTDGTMMHIWDSSTNSLLRPIPGRHGKGPPGYGPGPDLGPFFTNLDRTAVLFLGLERTWKVPDFLQIDRPVLFKLLKEDFQSISQKNSYFGGLFVHFSFKSRKISSPY